MTDLQPAPCLTTPHAVWRRVCPVADLEWGWGEAALVGGEQVAVFRLSGDAVYAVQQADPVTGAPVMARGITGSRTVCDRVTPTIASPLYKQVYDLTTGACLTQPAHRLRIYPTRLVDGWLELAV